MIRFADIGSDDKPKKAVPAAKVGAAKVEAAPAPEPETSNRKPAKRVKKPSGASKLKA